MTEQRGSDGLAREKTVTRRHRRNYGYRGYGSGLNRSTPRDGGMVHWAGGFSGLDFPGNSVRLALPRVRFFPGRHSERG